MHYCQCWVPGKGRVCLRSIGAGEAGSGCCRATEAGRELSEKRVCLQHEGGMRVVQGFGKGEMVLCGLCLVLTEEH